MSECNKCKGDGYYFQAGSKYLTRCSCRNVNIAKKSVPEPHNWKVKTTTWNDDGTCTIKYFPEGANEED